MAQYEMTFLLKQESDQEAVKKITNSFKTKVIEEKKWGKKTLAYSIKKQSELYFFSWTIELSEKELPDLRKKLDFNEIIIRYLIIKLDQPRVKKTF